MSSEHEQTIEKKPSYGEDHSEQTEKLLRPEGTAPLPPISTPASPVPAPPSRLSQALKASTGPGLTMLVVMLCASLLILAYGQSPRAVYSALVTGTLMNPFGLGQMLYKTTPLLFAGLSVALAFRAGLFNVGAEGQVAMGGFCAAIAGMLLPASTPMVIAIPVVLLAAFAGGALIGLIPGCLKAYAGAHEVITTIMLNFIVMALLNYLLISFFRVPETLHTPPIVEGARMMKLSTVMPALHGSGVSLALFGALIMSLLVWYLFEKTKLGYEWRAIGHNPLAAETAGMPIKIRQVLAFAVAGGIAGLGSLHFVLGYKYYFEEGFGAGVGFMGVAVALLARNHPLAVIPAALLFGWLSQGGLAINALVPRELIDILQAVLILALVSSPWILRRWLKQEA
ncbi:MAG TPA: ABC transporter permease [Candidatus Obscuribacterales bacterium]